MIPLLLALGLSFINFFGDHIADRIKEFHIHVISLASGMFVTIIFLEILPLFVAGSENVGEPIYLFFLGGFVIFHLLEKYIYQHVPSKTVLTYELSRIHAYGFAIDNFIIGFILVQLYELPGLYSELEYLAFIPFFLRVFALSVSSKFINESFEPSRIERILLSSSTFLGASLASSLILRKEQFFLVFSFLIGILLYSVVRDMIPTGKEGKPKFFLTGVLISFLLIWVAKLPLL